MRKLVLLIMAMVLVLSVVACGSSTTSDSGDSGANKEPGTEVTPPASDGNAAIDISNYAFSPETATVKVGTEVVWTNNDDVTHDVAADDNSFSSPSMGRGDTFSHVFDKAGTFPYNCPLHPSMTGTIVVK